MEDGRVTGTFIVAEQGLRRTLLHSTSFGFGFSPDIAKGTYERLNRTGLPSYRYDLFGS